MWFQRASDCVRKLISGDVDMAIVGYDMVKEFGKVRTVNDESRSISLYPVPIATSQARMPAMQ